MSFGSLGLVEGVGLQDFAGSCGGRAGTTQQRAPSPAVRTFNRTVRRSKRGEAGLFCVPEQRRRTARAPDARDDHRTARCGSLRSPLACP